MEHFIQTNNEEMRGIVHHTNMLLNKWDKYLYEQRCIENDWNNRGKQLTLFIDPETEYEFSLLACGPLQMCPVMGPDEATPTLFGRPVKVIIVLSRTDNHYYDYLTYI